MAFSRNILHLTRVAMNFNRVTSFREMVPALSTSRFLTRTITTTGKRDSIDSQTLTLPDGRILGYAEFGHPKGRPLLFFHGFPASRLEAWGAHKIARRCQIRVISIDRPGFGLSTFQTGRRITDWPNDVLAFANQMNLKRFDVLGGSGGGPYALACALKLPKEMVSAVGVMAGAPPWEAGVKKMSRSRRAISWAANKMPATLGVVADALVGMARWTVASGPVTRRIDTWIESERRKETTKLKTDSVKPANMDDEDDHSTVVEQRERLLRIVFDGFCQGSQAFVQEAQLLSSQDWGFKFEDISYDPVHIWHGTEDANAPFPMIQYMAKRIPHSILHEFEGETHYTMHKHLEQILMELAPKNVD
jgi:pimeloyl-ACP methyl ester carboxylesterase